MEDLKYEYYLYTWGGFYNEEYLKIHNKPKGSFWFNTKEERDSFIQELKDIENKLNAKHLAMNLSEGYCCRIETIAHRVVEYKNKQYYTTYNLGVNYPLSAAKYMIEYKWYPGFNDYPLGEDFNDYNNLKIIQEWITGADQEKYNN
jgi:hypothetical protein